MAADVLKAKAAVAYLRNDRGELADLRGIGLIETKELREHITNLMDTFDWVLESRTELMRAMELLRDHAARTSPVPAIAPTYDERGFLQPVKVEPHDAE